jgi:hypothetical protein
MEINTQFPIKGLMVFYLLIVANFLAPLFNCRLQDVLVNNMILKHMFGFLTLFFFVVFVEPEHSDKTFTYQIVMALGLYVWFVFTTKMEIHAFAIFILVLFSLYMFNIYFDRNSKHLENDKKEIVKENINRYGLILGLLITMIGFASYVGQKKIEFGSRFTWTDFFLGNPECKKESPIESKLQTIHNMPRFIAKALH